MIEQTETLVEAGKRINAEKADLPDQGFRRHLSWGMDFDTRSTTLKQEIGEHWDDGNKKLWRDNQAKVREGLKAEFGELGLETKIDNFVEIDSKPFSTLSYHNKFFHQVRQAYVIGAYYPALVGACALGERILNHLIIDLREFFTATPEYPRIHRKKSFDNWDTPIDALEAWNVLLPDVATEFRALKELRHRSIHFNVETYATLKGDALAAILHMRSIIDLQFGSHGLQPWFIKGTKGHQFIAKDWETNPFIQTYFLRNCPFVGPLFSIEHNDGRWEFIDDPNYGEGRLTDEAFARAYEAREPSSLAQRESMENR